jgi:hypothetical protein
VTRALRPVVDRAGVLARPADHQPSRPGWTCTQGCGDWPCAAYRGHLLATLDRGAIMSLMESHYPTALVELGEAHVVDARLFGWARRGEVRRPPGGPW